MAQGDPEEQTQAGATSAGAGAGTGDLAAARPSTAGRSASQKDESGALDEAGELEESDDEYEFADELGEPVETVDEQGRRHIRRAAPEGTEQILENEAPRHTGLPDKAERWRMRSATGTVLTAFAFGLQNVFEPDRNQPAIIMETSGDPPRDLPVEAQLEQLGPRQSSVTVRSWLLGNNLPGTTSGDGRAERADKGTTSAGDEAADRPSNGAEHPTPASGEETGG